MRTVILWGLLTISAMVLAANVFEVLWPFHPVELSQGSLSTIVGSFLALVGVVIGLVVQYENRVSHTVSVSPNNSDAYLNAWDILQTQYPNIGGSGNPVIDVDKFPKKGSFEHRKFLVVLNFWGRIATLYRENVIDQALAAKMYKFGFLRFINYFWPYIEAKREPGLYVDTEFLMNEWNEK